MKLTFLLLFFFCLIFNSVSAVAQSNYSIPNCNFSKSQKFVGDRLRLPLPKGAIIKKGRDHDYEDYYIGFGKKVSRVWISGIYGPHATSGAVPEDKLSASSEIVQRTWEISGMKVVDARGKQANGNFWRYIGTVGESVRYEDVPAEAAAYFDRIIDNLCFQEWK